MKTFAELTEKEILALAISSEDDDARTYMTFANALQDQYPNSARVFIDMAEEEHEHRRWLTKLYQEKFGDFIPLIRRDDVTGFVKHQPAWLMKHLTLDIVRKRAEVMELENFRFYKQSAERSKDPEIKKLLLQLAEAEKAHESLASRLTEQHLSPEAKLSEKDAEFGDFIPLIRRDDVTGFVKHQPAWLMKHLTLDIVRKRAEVMELENFRFYKQSAERSKDPEIKKLLLQLAEAEKAHESLASRLTEQHLSPEAKLSEKDAEHQLFLLQIVQPGLLGLMDGSVSTLAPLFAAAFATHSTWETFLVGSAASVGAGISMGFAEALSDDGELTGRGHPWIRGTAAGVMTAIGGLGHTLPYLIPDFWTATVLAVIIVFIELWAISWIRYKYMDTPFLRAAFQIAVGGFIVFLAGIAIGNA